MYLSFKAEKVNKELLNQIDTEERAKLIDGIVDELKVKTLTPLIKLTAKRGNTTPFSSKFGGTPYLPPQFTYPMGKNGPLHLLAQLNFEELPTLPHIEHEDGMFPFEGEFELHGEKGLTPISAEDFRFHKQAMSLYKAAFHDEKRLPDDICERFSELSNSGGHHIGGYPFFTQTDPRGNNAQYAEHTVLLLQIDSDEEIMWGDCGVANFFIAPEKLKAKDFSDVLYTWDCC